MSKRLVRTRPKDAVLMGFCLGISALIVGCPPPSNSRTLTLAFDGLEMLGDGWVYEGWLIVDGSPVSTGIFSVDADGALSQGTFDVAKADADNATAFVLTIEPSEGDDPAPSATHVLAGDLVDSAADLSIGHGAALGDDFLSAVGTFILNTPSTADTDEDYDQGIWWLDPAGGPGPGPSLTLPVLPDGWMYEGWVADAEGPISTGRFTDATGADSDGSGPDAGPDSAPAFPGQDFIDPALVLIGKAAVISVEPEPDDSPAPFALKPLVDGDIEDVGIGVPQDMGNNTAASEPIGTATIS